MVVAPAISGTAILERHDGGSGSGAAVAGSLMTQPVNHQRRKYPVRSGNRASCQPTSFGEESSLRFGRNANLSQPLNGPLLMESHPEAAGVKSDDVGSMDEGLQSS